MANSSFAASANRSDRRIALRAKVPALAAGAPESWVEMAYESQWKGHPSGEFAFTRESFEDIARIFAETSNPLPVTYGHPDHSSGRPTPAAGWIHELQIRNGDDGAELWARVAWTEEAADFIRAGQYRYCSVVVDFAPIDRASGAQAGSCELYELALTNSPFLPDQNPITLSRVGTPARAQQRNLAMATPIDPTKMVEGVAKSLGLKKDATLDEIKALLDAVFAFVGAMPGSAKGAPPDFAAAAAELSRVIKLEDFLVPAAEDAEEATETAAAMVLGKLVTATGLDEAAVVAGVEANLDAIGALITGTPSTGLSSDAPAQSAALARELSVHKASAVALSATVTELRATVATLSKDLEVRTASEKETRIKAHFSRLFDEGRVAETHRADFVTACSDNEPGALRLYNGLPVQFGKPPIGQVVSGPTGAPPKSTPQAVIADVSKLDPTDPRSLARQSSKGAGLKGAAAAEYEARWLSKHAERHPSA